MSSVAIVDTGVANIASIRSAFQALGVRTELVGESSAVTEAERIVLPGVGDFATGMSRIRELNLESALKDVFDRGTPMLAICLGMQLLCSESEEAPGVPGLGIIPGRCLRLPEFVRVPQLGWNVIEPSDGSLLLRAGYAAFANSYALTEVPGGWRAAWTHYGLRFISALERGNTLVCQFHPELSGSYGMELISRWLASRSAASTNGMYDPESTRQPESSTTYEGIHRIIPCLDVRDGRVVKGIRFQNLRDAGDPAELASEYQAQGADEIVVLDIAASPRGIDTRLDTVRSIREKIHIPLTVGGGVRSVEDARQLLQAGADRVSLNTAAVNDPTLLRHLADAFGSQCITLAIDARQNGESWEVLVVGGREPAGLDVVEWARAAEETGAGEILLTSWDRDGTRSGADTELLAAVSGSVNIPVIASGGIGTVEDARNAIKAGAGAVLAASIFHDGDRVVKDLKDHLNQNGIAVRT